MKKKSVIAVTQLVVLASLLAASAMSGAVFSKVDSLRVAPGTGAANSSMMVAGQSGALSKLSVRLTALTAPGSVSLLLTGPTGAKIVFFSNPANRGALQNVALTFEDEAAAPMQKAASGTYRPAVDRFEAGLPCDTTGASACTEIAAAPLGHATLSGIFNGTDPNGIWTLSLISNGSSAQIAGGWSLDLTTSATASREHAIDGGPRTTPAAAVPIVTAVKGVTPTGTVNPGDTLHYNVVVGNDPTATASANGTTFSDLPDPNTTLVAGTVHASPIAFDDAYTGVGNTALCVGPSCSGALTVNLAGPTLLANDIAVTDAITLAAQTVTSTGGATVTIATDGTFTYAPNSATVGTTDAFTYTIKNSNDASLTGTGTATITFAGKVWYVKNNAPAGGTGTSTSPFNTLAASEAAGAAAANDIIYVETGDGTTTNQSLGITLKNGQQLIGNGVALVVGATTLAPAGTKPQITNTAVNGDGITLNTGNTVKGLTVTGAARHDINGTGFNTFTGDTLTLQTAANSGLFLNTFNGPVTLTNSAITNNGGGGGVGGLEIEGGTGNITIDNTNTISSTSGRTVGVSTRTSGTVTIGATITDNGGGIAVASNTGGIISFTGSQTLSTTTNPGVTLTSNSGATINFSGPLSITTTTGIGFNASGGGTVNVTGFTASVTTGAAASGVAINGMTIGSGAGNGVNFTSVNTTGATTGVALTSFATAGLVTIDGGTITNGTTGVSLQGTNTSLTLVNVTITGPTTGITNTINFGTLTGSGTVNISAATALNLTTGTVNGTFANVSSSGGTNGVNLNAIAGNWTVLAGTLTGASGATFNIAGGSSTITWGGNISQSNGANVVAISGNNSSSITVGGNVTSSGTSTGLSIAGSTGTYHFNGTNAFSGVGGITIGAGGETGLITFSNNTTNTVSGDAFVVDGTSSSVSAGITYSGTIDKATSPSGGFLVKVNKLNGGGTLTMSHAPAAAGNLKQNFATASGISITNSSTIGITISDASVTFGSTAAGFTASGNSGGTITLNGIALAGSGNKAGMLISGFGTINVASGAAASSINMTGGTNSAIDGATTSYTGILNLTNAVITGNGAAAVKLTGSIGLGGNGSSITNAGPALVLTNVALTNGAGMSGVTSSAGVNGISLTGVTGGGGTYTIGNGGSLSGNTGSAFLVSGGSATLSYAGSISGGNQSVNISGATGGTITFSGVVLLSTGGNPAVSLTTNTGATIKFSNPVVINATSGAGFTATGGGTVTATSTATAGTVAGGVMTAVGSGYGSAPLVTFSAPGSGTTATGTAIVSGGVVTGVTITNPGSGYTTAPLITFGGPGAGAAATAVLGASSSITTTTGTALNVTDTIGASNLKFQSITAGTGASGPASGIILNGTGASGGLIVSGTGSAGSGGTIQKTTGDSISLTNTENLDLSWMNIQNSSAGAINGTGVNGFSLTSCSITGNVGGSNLGNTAAVILIDTTNAVSFVNDNISGTTGANGFNVQLDNSTTSSSFITTLTVTGGSYNNAAVNGGFLIHQKNAAKLGAAFFSGITFSGNFSKGLQLQQNDSSIMGDSTTAPLAAWGAGIPNGSITVTGCTFTNNDVAASFEGGGGSANGGATYYRFVNNLTITGSHSVAVNFANGATGGTGTFKVFCDGNHIGTAGVPGSGSAIGEGIRVFMQGKMTATATITNNVIRALYNGAGGFDARGIDVEELGFDGPGAAGPTPLDVKITGNDIDQQYSGAQFNDQYAIYVAADGQTDTNGFGSGSNVKAEIHGNTVPAATACDSSPCSPTGMSMVWMETVSNSHSPAGALYNAFGDATVNAAIINHNSGNAGATQATQSGAGQPAITLSATAPNTVN